MKILIKIFLFLSLISCEAQGVYTSMTPSGQVPYSAFTDLAGWWRADTFTGSSGSYSLTDKSSGANNMVQQAGTLTAGTGVNSQAKFTGNSSAYFNSSYLVKSWPVTIITVALRANNALCGFYGHQGASGFNTLWTGYEASNANTVYNTSGSTNTTTEAGTIAVYTTKIGWGSRQTWVNGVLKSTHTEPTITQSAATATTIGTQYRGLNCDWYETLVWNRTLSLSDLDEVYAYLNTRYAISLPLWSSYTAAPTILIWGQSNASGRGTPKSYLTSPYNTAQTNVFIWDGSTWPTLDESANNNDYYDGFGSTYFGYEASLGYNYINRVGGSVYLFKVTQGGTYLNNQGGVFWAATDNSISPNSGNKLYSVFQQNWTDALIAFQTASKRPVVKAIIGTQGEQDATDATASSNYQSNLIAFYNTMRPELGTNVNNSDVPVYITQLPNGQAGETYLSTVQSAQSNAASTLSNAHLFTTNSYSFQAGNVHFSNASYVQMGIDLAALF